MLHCHSHRALLLFLDTAPVTLGTNLVTDELCPDRNKGRFPEFPAFLHGFTRARTSKSRQKRESGINNNADALLILFRSGCSVIQYQAVLGLLNCTVERIAQKRILLRGRLFLLLLDRQAFNNRLFTSRIIDPLELEMVYEIISSSRNRKQREITDSRERAENWHRLMVFDN